MGCASGKNSKKSEKQLFVQEENQQQGQIQQQEVSATNQAANKSKTGEEQEIEKQEKQEQSIQQEHTKQEPPKQIQQQEIKKEEIVQKVDDIKSLISEIIKIDTLEFEIPVKIEQVKQYQIISSQDVTEWLFSITEFSKIDELIRLLKINSDFTKFKICNWIFSDIKKLDSSLQKQHPQYFLIQQILQKYQTNFEEIIPDLVLGCQPNVKLQATQQTLISTLLTYHTIKHLKIYKQINKDLLKSVSTLINLIQDAKNAILNNFPFLLDLKFQKKKVHCIANLYINDLFKDTCDNIKQLNYKPREHVQTYLLDLYDAAINDYEERFYNVDDEYDDLHPQTAKRYNIRAQFFVK